MRKSEDKVGSLAQRPLTDRTEVEDVGVVVHSGRCDGILEDKGVEEGLPMDGNGVDGSA